MQLQDMQSIILDRIINGNESAEAESKKLSEFIEYPDRFFIYKNGYFERIKAALLETYGCTTHVLGENAFEEIASGYQRYKKIAAYDLFGACDDFPEYIRTSKVSEIYPFLAELAEFELKCAKSFHEKGFTPISLASFANILRNNPEKAIFKVQPYVSTNISNWPLIDICNAMRNPQEDQGLFNIDAIKKCESPEWQIIFRRNWQVKSERLSKEQAAFFELIRSGVNLSAACASLEIYAAENGLSERDLRVHEWLCHWVQNDVFYA